MKPHWVSSLEVMGFNHRPKSLQRAKVNQRKGQGAKEGSPRRVWERPAEGHTVAMVGTRVLNLESQP